MIFFVSCVLRIYIHLVIVRGRTEIYHTWNPEFIIIFKIQRLQTICCTTIQQTTFNLLWHAPYAGSNPAAPASTQSACQTLCMWECTLFWRIRDATFLLRGSCIRSSLDAAVARSRLAAVPKVQVQVWRGVACLKQEEVLSISFMTQRVLRTQCSLPWFP